MTPKPVTEEERVMKQDDVVRYDIPFEVKPVTKHYSSNKILNGISGYSEYTHLLNHNKILCIRHRSIILAIIP